jgi:hypothetical protein
MKPNGWIRLWLFVSALYFVCISFWVIINIPMPEQVHHKSKYYDVLNGKARSIIMITSENGESKSESENKPALAKIKEREMFHEYSNLDFDKLDFVHPSCEEFKLNGPEIIINEKRPFVVMPNGHGIFFTKEAARKDINDACNEYWKIIWSETNRERFDFIFKNFLFWILPCIGLYLFGYGINWVYKGFKKPIESS